MGLTDRLDAGQQRHPVFGFPLAVLYKYIDDQGGYLAALIAWVSHITSRIEAHPGMHRTSLRVRRLRTRTVQQPSALLPKDFQAVMNAPLSSRVRGRRPSQRIMVSLWTDPAGPARPCAVMPSALRAPSARYRSAALRARRRSLMPRRVFGPLCAAAADLLNEAGTMLIAHSEFAGSRSRSPRLNPPDRRQQWLPSNGFRSGRC